MRSGMTLEQINGASRHSDLLNPDDPVSMHLLMEHALGDSQQYEVFSVEEIDDLKKELSILSSRIDATKRKLANETKIRDAARSINRLNTPNGNDELAASGRKCEDLSQEVGRLESRQQEVQKLLLQHTAGILQITHKGFLEKDGAPPTSASEYVNGHRDAGLLDHGFDDRSFYSTLDAMLDTGHATNGASAFAQQTKAIAEMQQRIWDLNRRLRDAIQQASSGRQIVPAPPDPESSDKGDPEGALKYQIDYLEKGLDRMQKSQSEYVQGYRQSASSAEEKLEDLNTQLRSIILRTSLDGSSQVPLPPEISGRGPEGQISFLDQGLDTLEQHLQQLKESHQSLQDQSEVSTSKSLAHQHKVSEYEQTFQSLWDKIVQGEEAARNMDGASESVPREKFSMEMFASKVDLLNTRAAGLRSQKDILSRQIQQQRELNSKSDGEKDAKMTGLTAELEQTTKSLESAKKDFQDQLAAGKTTQNQLSTELQQIKAQHAALQQAIQAKSKEADKARNEMQRFEGEMVRLQTELTVAKAELDGAYGTRAQRAAEVAQHPALIAEVAALKERNASAEEELASHKLKHDAVGASNTELTARVQTLQKELSETISEFEVMTKSSIEYEKERESLETTVDGLRDRNEALETQLSEEKVRWLGMKSPGVAGDQSSNEKGATSTSVLKNEFKKMMRETRAENARQLRVSLLWTRVMDTANDLSG